MAHELMGAGRRWLKPGADPIGDLIREREQTHYAKLTNGFDNEAKKVAF
jgi:hypothetical protein